MENEYIQEELDEWVEIQSPSHKNVVDSVIITGGGFLRDSKVFPQSNHEGLQVGSSNENQLSEVQQRFSSSSSSSSLCSGGTDADREGEDEEVKDKSVGRITFGLGCLRCRIVAIASRMRNYAVSKARILWLVTSATTGLVALLFVLLYLRVHRKNQRQVKLENKKQQQHHMLLIKEKDQKIAELLFQIAQLNDILLKRRRVPVLQVG